jgi:tRNA threonylcarbamoyladenosine biosynthesis protein TsaB
MKILILETSSEKGCMILADGENPIAVQALSSGPELSKRLGAETDALLKLHKFKPDLIAIGTGPGSYTGIRVGAALAKALAYGWQIPLIGFCSLKGFSPPIEGAFAVLADAKMGGLYAVFGERIEGTISFEEPLLLSPSDPRFQKFSYFSSPHPEAVRKRGAFEGLWFETAPDPQLLASLVCRQFLSEGAIPPVLTYLSSP